MDKRREVYVCYTHYAFVLQERYECSADLDNDMYGVTAVKEGVCQK